MPRFLVDTSCIVASLQPGHTHQSRALGELTRRADCGQDMVVAAHSLAEAYSVLSRLPLPHRASPRQAMRALQESFIDLAEVVALNGADYAALMHSAAGRGVVGGHVYDAIIAACALKAGVAVLLTFNDRHFRPLLPANVEVVVPSE